MTYIIAEPCIDIKDLSCVDVCPVDCIHEFERILIIDPEECIDCLLRRLPTACGSSPGLPRAHRRRLQPPRKRFREAFVRSGPAFEERTRYGGTRLTTRNISRFRGLGRVALPTARTGLARQSAVDARPGRTARRPVFGDGAWNKQEIRSGEHLHYVQLYGERVARYKDFFDQVNFSPCLDVHPGYVGTVVRREPSLASETQTYIAGFVDGWLAADGDPVKAGSWRLRSTDHEALAWLEAVAPYAGLVTVGSGEESSVETNFGVRSRPIRWLYLATREVHWRVMDVEEQEREAEDTFCAVVPDKHVSSGGFPEDALPQKWEPFVKINYAYAEGADVINKLTDEYATEHNVQNPPLE